MADNKLYWIALNLALADSLSAVKKVIGHFQSIRDVFLASRIDLLALGIGEDNVQALISSSLLDQASQEIEICRKKGYFILTQEEQEYPAYLREIFDPPVVLYGAGRMEVIAGPSVSIVGARKASPYGISAAIRLAQELASRGIVVVSGLARGIDSAAHRGALKGGKTVAVLGSGLENLYPRENRFLFEKTMEKGAVVSEFPLGASPLGFHFPIRNRIISGLSHALVVVEAARRSGSLISAQLALEQNREVMAVPGNITSELSQGANWLIKSGAKPVTCWEDVVEELPSPLREQILSKEKQQEVPAVVNPRERGIFDLLETDSLTHIDDLVERSDFSVSEALSILLSLELKGLITQAPGKYFQRSW